MRTTSISTMSLMNTPRTGVARMQADLVRLNREVVTGRMADVGLNLGSTTGRSVALRFDKNSLASLESSNTLAAARLDQTQSALSHMADGANSFLNQLITAKGSGRWDTTLSQMPKSALSAFISGVNASDGHDYLFGGINSSVPPIADFDAGPSAAIDAAFLAKFGVTQNDPAVASIAASDMADFIDNEFSQLFADPDWGTTWSSAADQTVTARIAPTETIDTSVSANQPAIRKLAMVYSMVATLGTDKLSEDARTTVLDKAMQLVGTAVDGLTTLQADLGARQNRVKDASERLNVQQTIIEQRIANIEGVDPAEAKVHIDTLSTQIEMSYSLTAKLLQISILNYV